MSSGDEEAVRRTYAAAARGDLDGFIAGFAPDASWDMTTAAGWPEPEVHRGHDGLREFIRRWAGTWDDFRSELIEARDLGDEVVAVSHETGRGKGSGVPLEQQRGHRFEVRDGLITRVRSYASKDDALAAIEAERG